MAVGVTVGVGDGLQSVMVTDPRVRAALTLLTLSCQPDTTPELDMAVTHAVTRPVTPQSTV